MKMQEDATMDILSKTYSNRPGTQDSGKEYEIKMAALLLLRCINQKNTTDAWLAMNVNHCGAFDDMVLYRQTKDGNEVIYLIQLKHEEKGSDIKAEEFRSKKKSSFLLSKYINSICEIKDSVARQQMKQLKETAMDEDLQLDGEGEDLVDFIRRNNCKIAYILFTNRGTTTGCSFLRHVGRKSAMDTRWMLYETINTTSKGNVCSFDFETLSEVYQGDLVSTESFFLFTKQEHLTKLSAALSNAIKNLIQPVKLAESTLSDVCLKFLQFMSDWSKGSLGGYCQLTKHQVLKKVMQLLLEPYVVKLEDPSSRIVEYRTDIWNQITMNSDVTIINQADDLTIDFVLDATTTILQQHCQSTKWWKDNEHFVKREVLAPKKVDDDIYQYLWKVKKIPVLLEVDDLKRASQLKNILKFCQRTFKVIILNKSDKALTDINALNTFVTLDSLNQDDRDVILLQPFTLQGRQSSVALNDLVDSKNIKDITAKDVIYILAQKFNIGDKPEPFPEFFEETSLSRVWLDISVLLQISLEVCIVKCYNMSTLKIVLQEHTVKATNPSVVLWPDIKENPEATVIVYKVKEEFREIENYCSRKGKQFHQLRFHDSGNLEWIKSSGPVINIKSFRRDSNITWKPLTKTELITGMISDRKPVLVSSDPGMGKSVLIKYIARNVSSNWWTLKLNLAEHIDIYNVWETETPSVQLFNSFINTILIKNRYINPLAKVLFQRYFENKQIIFLLDGFDEIPVSYQNGAKKLVKFICDAGYVLCLTTRPVFKIELESILNTFSVTLNLFTRINQENFLKNYFARTANTSTSDEGIISFVDQLLNATKRNLNDHDNLFIGVPLQTVLLAQVFDKSCVKYLQTGEFECKHFDLLFLYRHFFKEKLQIARNKVAGVSEDLISQYKVCRSFYALQLIFHEDVLKELQINQKLAHASGMFPLMIQLIQKDGVIVAEKENNVSFVHRTFAEYLAAEWLSENIDGEYKIVVHRLVKDIFQPNFEVIRNIFDRLLAQSCQLHLAIINRQVNKIQEIINSVPGVYKEKDKGNRAFLHLIASWGQHHPAQEPTATELLALRSSVPKDDMMKILKLIPTCELRNNCKDDILNYTPLDYAICSGALNVANAICTRLDSPYYFKLVTTLNNREQCMYKMNYHSLFNVFSKFGFSNVISSQGSCYKDRSLGKLFGAIERGDISSVLIGISKQKYLNASDPDSGYTPLHIAIIYGCPEVAFVLLKHKADPTKRDNSGRIPLHWVLSRNVETTNTHHQSSLKMDIENLSNSQFTSTSITDTTWDDITSILIDVLSKDKHLDIKDNDGNTAMNLAAHNGHINAIKMLLSQGANKELTNNNGDTPLITAACRGRTDIVDLLLLCGANKEARNCYGYTAFLAAILVGRTEMTDFLLSKGFCIESKGNSGNTALLVAAAGGHADIVSLLLSHGSNVNAKNKKGNTALTLTTYNGHIDVVNMLLLHDADIDTTRDDGNTALLIAAYHDLSDILRLLLSRGADKEARNKDDEVALTVAVSYRHMDIIKELLLWDVDKEAPDSDGNTALAIAALHGYADILTVLLSQDCNKEAINKEGKTPLILAAGNGHTDIVCLLLSKNVNKEAESKDGFTALAVASDNGHIDVVKLLLSHGSDKETRTERGATPLILAVESGHCDVVNLLLSCGANVEVKTYNGNTALIQAAHRGHANVLKILLSHGIDKEIANMRGFTSISVAAIEGHTDIVKTLLAANSNKEAKDIDGNTPLLLAAQFGHTDIVNLLVIQGADKESKNNLGKTALAGAACAGHIHVVKLLISLEGDREARTSEGATPLILAAWQGHADVVQLLLSAGSNKEAKTTRGDSALILAARQGHLDVIKVLLSHGCDKNVTNNDGDTAVIAATSSRKFDVVNFFCSRERENKGQEMCEGGSEAIQSKTNLNVFKNKSCSIS